MFTPENCSRVLDYIIRFGINLFAAAVIFFLGKWAAGLFAKLFEKAMMRSKINHTLISFAKNIIYFGILIFVAIAALNKVGIETNSFVAIVGAAGLAVGLALQGSLANFAAGVMIILFQPFEVGDTIEAGGAFGLVKEIQVFSTIIHTADNKRVIVPNAKITSDKITVEPRK
ncbi:MAG TPA: mechanosensitive ion channel [Candidatus Omnitrophota bacterium]|nr:mechanosensitive ion channel [Candidatus Omnitrophota bacterium]